MASATARDWTRIINLYSQYPNTPRWGMPGMLELAVWLASTDASHLLYPSTSHLALGLSTAATYEERLRRPMVYILPSPPPDGFTIHWQTGQGNEVSQEWVDSPRNPETFARILDWLGVEPS